MFRVVVGRGPLLHRACFSTGEVFKGPKVPKKWVEVKKAKKRARKLLERKDRGAKPLILPPEINPKSLSSAMGIRTLDILKLMIRLGERPWSAEQPINKDVVELICDELYFEPVWAKTTSDVDIYPIVRPKDMSALPRRPLVVTIMGHVDHGKTTLLDSLRKTRIADGEAGGITQHVRVFQTKLEQSGEVITLMDTPGHAAFASIRERGTNITDLACLVVAADDGVQDQTIEAIEYIRQREVPFIVVITKTDKPSADVEAVYMQLLQHDVALEKYGGDVVSVEVSAKTRHNLDALEDAILMQQEEIDPRADVANEQQAEAVVIETEVNRYTGVTCTLLVQWGKLKVGDAFVVGTTYGRVKSIVTPDGQQLKEALPSTPVIVAGFKEGPSPGELLMTASDERFARKVAENRTFVMDRAGKSEDAENEDAEDENGEESSGGGSSSSSGGGGKVAASGSGGEKKSLNIIVKADVEGSVEAIVGALESLPQDLVTLRFVKSTVGEVSLADVELAKDADAVLVGFNSPVSNRVKKQAESLEVDLVEADIIYSIVEHAKQRIESLLDPVPVSHVVGEAEVLQCFPLRYGSSNVIVGGSRVRSGVIKATDSVRVMRDQKVLYEGPVEELKKEKVVVKEVKSGMECGLLLKGFDGFKPGDIIQATQIKMEKRKIW